MNATARVIVLSLFLLGVDAALAQAPRLIEFGSLDTNHDGRISRVEARANPDLDNNFGDLDTNHDGYLSPEEFARWSRASKVGLEPRDPTTAPSGSQGSQHMPAN